MIVQYKPCHKVSISSYLNFHVTFSPMLYNVFGTFKIKYSLHKIDKRLINLFLQKHYLTRQKIAICHFTTFIIVFHCKNFILFPSINSCSFFFPPVLPHSFSLSLFFLLPYYSKKFMLAMSEDP